MTIRAVLLEQIAGAQQALEAQLEILRHAATVGGDTASLAMAQNQLSRLGGLHQRIEQMHGGGLAAIRAEVMATVAASQTMSQQARISTVSAQAAEAALHAASEQARREVTDLSGDLFERKIFDPYLRFASSAEEEAYREREAERQRYIEDQLSRGTPEGNLNAAAATVAQVRDAGAHGADQSPAYRSTLGRATRSYEDLRAATVAAGRSTEEADRQFQASQPVPAEPDAFAALRAAGVVFADQSAEGHGIAKADIDRLLARTV